MVRHIITNRGKGKAILHSVCAEVTDQEELRKVLCDLMDTLKATPNGVGLAAPQIGVPLRVFVVKNDTEFLGFVNPVILQTGDAVDTAEEGCLSLPGFHKAITRATWIRVVKQQMPGTQIVTMSAKWALARAIQHELDHLDGKLISRQEAPRA